MKSEPKKKVKKDKLKGGNAPSDPLVPLEAPDLLKPPPKIPVAVKETQSLVIPTVVRVVPLQIHVAWTHQEDGTWLLGQVPAGTDPESISHAGGGVVVTPLQEYLGAFVTSIVHRRLSRR